VTDVAEIAKRMRLMPACAICIDGHLTLHFMTVLAGRSLRTALRAGGCRRRQKNAGGDHKRQSSKEKIKSDLLMLHIFLLEVS
jgi:hypothetical protein